LPNSRIMLHQPSGGFQARAEPLVQFNMSTHTHTHTYAHTHTHTHTPTHTHTRARAHPHPPNSYLPYSQCFWDESNRATVYWDCAWMAAETSHGCNPILSRVSWPVWPRGLDVKNAIPSYLGNPGQSGHVALMSRTLLGCLSNRRFPTSMVPQRERYNGTMGTGQHSQILMVSRGFPGHKAVTWPGAAQDLSNIPIHLYGPLATRVSWSQTGHMARSSTGLQY
jgi:hypothetical protein